MRAQMFRTRFVFGNALVGKERKSRPFRPTEAPHIIHTEGKRER